MEQRDILIIGGGVAGLSAAQYAARANLNCLVIEEMAPGGQALLIDDLENYPGYSEAIKGYKFCDDMKVQAEKFGANFVMAKVKDIEKQGEDFLVETSKETYTAKVVVIATGAKHRHLQVPGEEEFSGRGVSYCATCDGPFFKNKKILVVGGGDAACDEAVYLSKLTDKLVMIHRRDRFRAQQSLAERVKNHEGIDVRLSHVITEIKGGEGIMPKVNKVVFKKTDTEETYEEEMDAVFIFVGTIPQTQLVPDLEKDEAGYIVTNQRMETSLPGMYAVGDVRNTPFRQVVTAASDGATAAHCAAQFIDELQGQAYN
ncbi:MAG: thioredoxin-disulfide reductase [Spirochaetaceae bacterium]|jgi:thioredoxin reductase (NADPH)|nr:thioredoxin-disulfide reductase [Spirochaetaceae bacterium]